MEAKEPGGRAFASRIVGRWHGRLDDPLALLAKRVEDDDAQVRMEAVAAAAAIPRPESITVVACAVDRPMDDSMEYVFSQAIQHLRPHWEAAQKRGDLQFAKSAHLAEVLNRAGGRERMAGLRTIALSYHLDEDTRPSAIENLLTRLSLQPCAHGGVFVGLVVVQDQAQVEMLRDLTVETLEETEKLLVVLPAHDESRGSAADHDVASW